MSEHIPLTSPGQLSRRAVLSTMSGATAALPVMSLAALAGSAFADSPLASSSAVPTLPNDRPLVLGMVLFDGFQLLDTFGPLEMFGALRDKIRIVSLSESGGPARSSAGPAVVIDHALSQSPPLDIIMIPGGGGTRREVNNAPFVSAFKRLAEATPYVSSVCTGAAVLARTGLLDGIPATTNKRAYRWATSQGPNVKWVAQARWVEHGKYFTSSGISAGMDMSLAMIDRLFGRATAQRVADGAEYEWNSDPHHDPFAKLNGLVD